MNGNTVHVGDGRTNDNDPGPVQHEKEKETMSAHAEFQPNLEPLDPIEALNMPNWKDVEKQLKRRLDLTLMPMLWILYFHNYLDRNNIA